MPIWVSTCQVRGFRELANRIIEWWVWKYNAHRYDIPVQIMDADTLAPGDADGYANSLIYFDRGDPVVIAIAANYDRFGKINRKFKNYMFAQCFIHELSHTVSPVSDKRMHNNGADKKFHDKVLERVEEFNDWHEEMYGKVF